MFVGHDRTSPTPRSEIVLTEVEDTMVGSGAGGAFAVLLEEAVDLHDSCVSATRDELLNPTSYDSAHERLTPEERAARADAVACVLKARRIHDVDSGTVTVYARCEPGCVLRPKAIADPAEIVIDNTVPRLTENYRNRL